MHEVFESNGMRVRYLHANGIRNESTRAGTSPAALSSCFSPMVLIFIFIRKKGREKRGNERESGKEKVIRCDEKK